MLLLINRLLWKITWVSYLSWLLQKDYLSHVSLHWDLSEIFSFKWIWITPYLRWCIPDGCKLSGLLPLCYTVGYGVSIWFWLIVNIPAIAIVYTMNVCWFCHEFHLGMFQGDEVSFLTPKYHFTEQKRTPHLRHSHL